MLRLHIVTPDSTVFDADIESVTLPGADGEMTILEHHIPLMTTLLPGTVIARVGGKEEYFAVARGVVEVDGSSVRILADIADRADVLEEAAIEKAKADAEKLLSEKRSDVEGFAEAAAILEKELARLRTVRRHRSMRSIPRPSSEE